VFCKFLTLSLTLISFAVSANHTPAQSLLPEVNQAPELLVFISFGMPKQSLKQWAEEVKRAEGTLLLRGFIDNSLQKTTQHILELLGPEPNIEIAIDPETFQQLKIQMVPAVVIKQPSAFNQNASPRFDIVTGDTSLEKALERIKQSGSPEGQKAARHFLKRYRAPNG
jgi:conjugal transfer pilus assembly protein TrbC